MPRTMQSKLRSSAEVSTPLKPNPPDCVHKTSQHTKKTKNNKKKNFIKSTTLYPSQSPTPHTTSRDPPTYENLDVDPLFDVALLNMDISRLRGHGIGPDDPKQSTLPTMTRQQMIMARRLPLFNFPSSLYFHPPPNVQHIQTLKMVTPASSDLDLPSYDPPNTDEDPLLGHMAYPLSPPHISNPLSSPALLRDAYTAHTTVELLSLENDLPPQQHTTYSPCSTENSNLSPDLLIDQPSCSAFDLHGPMVTPTLPDFLLPSPYSYDLYCSTEAEMPPEATGSESSDSDLTNPDSSSELLHQKHSPSPVLLALELDLRNEAASLPPPTPLLTAVSMSVGHLCKTNLLDSSSGPCRDYSNDTTINTTTKLHLRTGAGPHISYPDIDLSLPTYDSHHSIPDDDSEPQLTSTQSTSTILTRTYRCRMTLLSQPPLPWTILTCPCPPRSSLTCARREMDSLNGNANRVFLTIPIW